MDQQERAMFAKKLWVLLEEDLDKMVWAEALIHEWMQSVVGEGELK